MKRLFVLCLIMFFVFTAWVTLDRWRTQQRILNLEWQVAGLKITLEMREYRSKHPFKHPP